MQVELEEIILIFFLSFLCYCHLLPGEASSASEQIKIQNKLFFLILVCLQIKQIIFIFPIIIQIKFNTRKSDGREDT